MRKLKLQTLMIYGFAILSGVVLLYTSQNVQKAEDRLAEVRRASANEAEAIRVLRAEWAYLNSPARLEALAENFLALEPADPEGVMLEADMLPDAREAFDVDEGAIVGQPVAATFPPTSAHEVGSTPALVSTPPRKPAAPRRVQKEKAFDSLLDALSSQESGGGQ